MNSRRLFLKTISTALASIPAVLISQRFGAQWIPQLAAAPKKCGSPPAGESDADPKDPLVTALKYQTDATKVKEANYKKGQNCSSCMFYTSKDECFGKCQIIPKGVVRAAGWCSSYQVKKS